MNITGLSLRVLQELRGEIQPDNIHYSKHREVMVISPVEASFPIPPYASYDLFLSAVSSLWLIKACTACYRIDLKLIWSS